MTVATPTLSVPYLQAIAAQAAQANGVDPTIFLAQIQQESGWNPNALSSAGAQGIAQIMPATATGWGVNPWNPVDALNAAAKAMGGYLQQFGGDYASALAAYNAGPGAVQKYGGVPPFAQTQNYVNTILTNAANAGSTAAVMSSPSSIVQGVLGNAKSALGKLGSWNPLSPATIAKALGFDPQTAYMNGGLALLGLVLVAIGGVWLIERSLDAVGNSAPAEAVRRLPGSHVKVARTAAQIAAIVK